MKISKLHFITTNARHAEEACRGGIDWIQLRVKDAPYGELYTIAREVQAICRKWKATFIINDNVELAKSLEADGVHLGKEDMNPVRARTILGNNFIIGCTANTIEDVTALTALPVDYIGLGPYRFTETKKNLSPVLGVEGYVKIFDLLRNTDLIVPPVIGIGGIREDDVPELLAAGLYGIAIAGAISAASNVTEAARSFANALTLQTH